MQLLTCAPNGDDERKESIETHAPPQPPPPPPPYLVAKAKPAVAPKPKV